ncbi:hypothetical protein KKE19_02480 [Patescibacteria group bacterium]|nr:hypothetical protein [Patescibacteria group bacterium]MBU4367702.1 hypothetical protein [Patescibacteria group bacterium]MBU4461848.1 hypothetical protein [Patescibacteria group bacterium]MCG2700021.1 hypothetical protein [Candidatus Parcubacteria bacterium]
MKEFLIGATVFIILFFVGYYLGKYKKWFILKNLGFGKHLLRYFIIMLLTSMGVGLVFGSEYVSLAILIFFSFWFGQCFGKDPSWTNL